MSICINLMRNLSESANRQMLPSIPFQMPPNALWFQKDRHETCFCFRYRWVDEYPQLPYFDLDGLAGVFPWTHHGILGLLLKFWWPKSAKLAEYHFHREEYLAILVLSVGFLSWTIIIRDEEEYNPLHQTEATQGLNHFSYGIPKLHWGYVPGS